MLAEYGVVSTSVTPGSPRLGRSRRDLRRPTLGPAGAGPTASPKPKPKSKAKPSKPKPATNPTPNPATGIPRWSAAGAGLLAGGGAVAVGELLGRLVPGAASPLVALGDAVIRLAPPSLRDAGIETFGTADKPVLLVSVGTVVALLAALVGLRARTRPLSGESLVVALSVVPLLAIVARTGRGSVGALATTLAMAATGVLLLRALLGRRAGTRPTPRLDPTQVAWSRRVFLVRAGAVLVATATAGALARWLDERIDIEAIRRRRVLATPVRPAPGDVAAASLDVDGISPLITPNNAFYRIDTALIVPRVDPADWTLSVSGMVDRPLSFSYDDLLAMPQYEADITLQCVSNEVGGDLVGNARWQGVLLRDLLERARVRAGADQVVGRSVDNFTAGFPTAIALDGRAAMVALGMNGEPLPQLHGFPARLVVPGLYGYVSATKWLSSIELTTLAGFDGFWVPRGWSKLAPIKTSSRIDVPQNLSRIPVGPTVVAGVAWSPGPQGGIDRVEVRVDDGRWVEAVLGGELSEDTWRQWRVEVDLPPGEHVLSVRATDRSGVVQDDQRRPLRPDGATGHHQILILADA